MTKTADDVADRDDSNRCPSHWWRAYALHSAVDGSEATAATAEPKQAPASARPAKPARAAAAKS